MLFRIYVVLIPLSLSLSLKSIRGVTLFELLISIAIIAILAVVLYPMTTDYLKRGRDASRKADLNTVSLALNAFFLDHRIYPESDSNGCLAPDTFTRTHPNYRTQIPYSPSGEQYDEWCWPNGLFGYGVSGQRLAFVLMARTEIPHAGNFSGSVDGMIRELTPDAMERIRAYQNDPNAGRPSNIFLISNGIIFSGSAPSTPSLPVWRCGWSKFQCQIGNPIDRSDNFLDPIMNCGGQATWKCQGHGWVSQECRAQNPICPIDPSPLPVNGVCSTTRMQCVSGTSTGANDGYTGVNCGGNATWQCVWAHGGTTESCSVANPSCASPRYEWSVGSWSRCSGACGTGTQTRTVRCVNRTNNTPVADSFCSGTKPAASQSCTHPNPCLEPEPPEAQCGWEKPGVPLCRTWVVSSYSTWSCNGQTPTRTDTWTCGPDPFILPPTLRPVNCSWPVGSCSVNAQCWWNRDPIGTCRYGTRTGPIQNNVCGQTAQWTCAGLNGGTSVSCSRQREPCPPIHGSCGTSQFQCLTGTVTNQQTGYTGVNCGGNSTWTCQWLNGWNNQSCSRPNAPCPINGVCGTTAGTCTTGSPAWFTQWQCGGNSTWTCQWANGWTNSSCSRQVQCPLPTCSTSTPGQCIGGNGTVFTGTGFGYNGNWCYPSTNPPPNAAARWQCTGTNATQSAWTVNCTLSIPCPRCGGLSGSPLSPTCSIGTVTHMRPPVWWYGQYQWACTGWHNAHASCNQLHCHPHTWEKCQAAMRGQWHWPSYQSSRDQWCKSDAAGVAWGNDAVERIELKHGNGVDPDSVYMVTCSAWPMRGTVQCDGSCVRDELGVYQSVPVVPGVYYYPYKWP